ERRAAGPVGVINGGNFAVGIEREKGRVAVFGRQDVNPVRLVSEARFLKHDTDLYPIGRRSGKQLQPIRVKRRPARENWMVECHLLLSSWSCRHMRLREGRHTRHALASPWRRRSRLPEAIPRITDARTALSEPRRNTKYHPAGRGIRL